MNKSVAVLASLLAFAASAETPKIDTDSVAFSQNRSSRLVTIAYELQETNAIVTVDFLTNGVSIGAANFANVDGDVNRIVAPGKRLITWQPAASWPNHRYRAGDGFSARLKAWRIGCNPDYMVVDLTETNAAPRFYVSTDAFPGGGLTNDVYRTKKLVMRRIPAAGVRWTMGSPTTEVGAARATDGRETQHEVTLTEDFYLGIYTVSQGQQVEAIGQNTAYPSHRTNDQMVVNNTNYIQLRGAATEADWPTHGHHVAASSILGMWRAKTGIDFDLPTSAQWEYACRAGCGNTFFFGVDLTTNPTLLPVLNAYAWFGGANGNSGNIIHLIGKRTPNPWGLYDMYGNLWEACLDWLTTSYADHETDPKGATSETSNTYRVYRGGAYGSAAYSCRSASISKTVPNSNTATGQAASWSITYRLACPASLVWTE